MDGELGLIILQSAHQLLRYRIIKGAVPEVKDYSRNLCNQHCKTHLYFKNGIPYDQATGFRHDCIMTRIAKMFIAHYNMIRISQVRDADLCTINDVLTHQEEWNRKWDLAFNDWKVSEKGANVQGS